jgi:hypothetical protein
MSRFQVGSIRPQDAKKVLYAGISAERKVEIGKALAETNERLDSQTERFKEMCEHEADCMRSALQYELRSHFISESIAMKEEAHKATIHIQENIVVVRDCVQRIDHSEHDLKAEMNQRILSLEAELVDALKRERISQTSFIEADTDIAKNDLEMARILREEADKTRRNRDTYLSEVNASELGGREAGISADLASVSTKVKAHSVPIADLENIVVRAIQDVDVALAAIRRNSLAKKVTKDIDDVIESQKKDDSCLFYCADPELRSEIHSRYQRKEIGYDYSSRIVDQESARILDVFNGGAAKSIKNGVLDKSTDALRFQRWRAADAVDIGNAVLRYCPFY